MGIECMRLFVTIRYNYANINPKIPGGNLGEIMVIRFGVLRSALDRAGLVRSAQTSSSRDTPPQEKVPEDHCDQQ